MAVAADIFAALQTVLAAYFGFYTLLLLVAAVFAGVYRLRGRRWAPPENPTHRFAVLLPAYRAGEHFLNVVDAVKAQDYPPELVDVYVLAQRCEQGIVDGARERGATVWDRAFDDGTPGNPYLRALRWFVPKVVEACEGGYDLLLLVDKDNILAPDFLRCIEAPFHHGATVAQGIRLPLNLDTTAARLDFAAETMNDQTLRAARAAAGLSAEISGSGVAYRPEVWLRALETVDLNSPVQDKTTLLELLKAGVRVDYCPAARLYEEKTGSFGAIAKQRTRWVGGQFYLARKHGLRAVWRGLTRGEPDMVDFGLMLWRPPRALHAAALPLMFAISWLWPVAWLPGPVTWAVLASGYVAAVLAMLALAGTPARVYGALLLGGPRFALGIARATISGLSGKVQGTFIHTEHAGTLPRRPGGDGEPH